MQESENAKIKPSMYEGKGLISLCFKDLKQVDKTSPETE